MNTCVRKMYSAGLVLGFFALAAFMLPIESQAQIHEIDQTIYGMDCAPCAYGVENRMKRMEGATNVSLSLNEGKTVAQFAEDSAVTLRAIRDAIRRGGFDAREATLRMTGTLRHEGAAWILSLPSGEQFQLDQYEDVISAEELHERSGEEITLTGHVREGYSPPENGWVLHVMDLDVERL